MVIGIIWALLILVGFIITMIITLSPFVDKFAEIRSHKGFFKFAACIGIALGIVTVIIYNIYSSFGLPLEEFLSKEGIFVFGLIIITLQKLSFPLVIVILMLVVISKYEDLGCAATCVAIVVLLFIFFCTLIYVIGVTNIFRSS